MMAHIGEWMEDSDGNRWWVTTEAKKMLLKIKTPLMITEPIRVAAGECIVVKGVAVAGPCRVWVSAEVEPGLGYTSPEERIRL